MLILSLVFAAAVSVAPKEIHYYPEKVKPVIHAETTPTKVCPLGKKANFKDKLVCLNCEDGLTYIDPWCYRCPDGARLAHIRRKAVDPDKQVRCIVKESEIDAKRWREMPKLELNPPKKKPAKKN